jgi:hypothetical protein
MINLFAFVAEEEIAIRFAQTELVDKDSIISYKFLEPVGQFEVAASLTEKDYLSFGPLLEGFWVRSIPYEDTL